MFGIWMACKYFVCNPAFGRDWKCDACDLDGRLEPLLTGDGLICLRSGGRRTINRPHAFTQPDGQITITMVMMMITFSARVHWSRLWIKSIRGAKTLFSHGSAAKPLLMGEKFLFLKFMASLTAALFDTIFNMMFQSWFGQKHCQKTREIKGGGQMLRNQELPDCIFHFFYIYSLVSFGRIRQG